MPPATISANACSSAAHQLLAAVSDDAEKGVVGLKNPAFNIPDADPDDVGVD
jgi:hypothetical protein